MGYINGLLGHGLAFVAGCFSCFIAFHRNALRWLAGSVAIAALVIPSVIVAETIQGVVDSSNLSCQLNAPTSLSIPSEAPIQSIPKRQTTISGLQRQRERCRKPVLSIRRLLRSNHAQLVDVRRPESYRQSHLRGSINIPEYQIKTKAFLKERSLVLVGKGHDDSRLFESCISLLQDGFKGVVVLEGGVQGWRETLGGGGSESSEWVLPTINAREAFSALQHEEWVLVENMPQESTDKFKELAQGVPSTSLLQLTTTDSPVSNMKYLLISEDGGGYKQVADRLQKAGIVTAYWLDGGVKAYNSFLNNRVAQLAKLQREPVRRVGCGVL